MTDAMAYTPWVVIGNLIICVMSDGSSSEISEKGVIYISQRMRTAASARWDVSQQYSGKGKLMKELNHVTGWIFFSLLTSSLRVLLYGAQILQSIGNCCDWLQTIPSINTSLRLRDLSKWNCC